MKKILIITLVAFMSTFVAFAQEEAVTASGKKVMLHKDGTWTLIKEAPASTPAITPETPTTQKPTPKTTNVETKRTTSVQCSGRTQKGLRCKRMTLATNGRCYQH